MAKKQDQFEDHYERKREQKERHLRNSPGEGDPPLPPSPETIKNKDAPLGRNDPCPCGSGKKYKQCCLKKER